LSRHLALVLVACSAPQHAPPPPRGGDAATIVRDAAGAAPIVAPQRLPDGVAPLRYDLRLELDPDADTFRGDVRITARADAPVARVWLHAEQLELERVELASGEAIALPATTGGTLRALDLPRPISGTFVLHLAYAGHVGGDERGVFRERAGDRFYLFTQAESVFARRIVPCFDEPRFKTPWHVTLVVPGELVALGNAPQIAERARADNRRDVEFADTPPLASYLLAVAVGPFERVDAGTVGAKRVPLRVFVQQGDRGRAGVVGAELPAIVAEAERYTGDALPLAKLDIVAVPHLFGAMEHPGLVTFNAPVVIGDGRAPDADHFARMAAHEIAHQWFGNLVTPAWWDDLWLAETFAEWLGNKLVDRARHVDPAPRLARARAVALAADDEPGALPLHRAVARGDETEAAFDAIAYEKGEAVLDTFERFVGEDALQRALRGYLRAHRDGTATARDVVAAIANETTPAVGAAFATYLEHAGAPVVELASRCDVRGSRVVGRARGDFIVPACVRHDKGRACGLVATASELAATACPTWLVGNVGGRGYYHVAWTPAATPPLAALDDGEQLALAHDAAASIARGDVGIVDALAAARSLARDNSPAGRGDRAAGRGSSARGGGRRIALAIARAIDPLVGDDARAAWTRWLVARFGDPTNDRELLALVGAAAASPVAVRRARAIALRELAAKHPGDALVPAFAIAANAELVDRAVAALRSSDDRDARDRLAEALRWTPSSELARLVELALADQLPIGVLVEALAGAFERADTRAAAWAAVRAHALELLGRLSVDDADDLVAPAGVLCDARLRSEVAVAFGARVDPHAIDRALARIDRCIARRAGAGDVAGAISRDK
jgi:alanyl aminopeptidase